MLGVAFKGARCKIHNPALFKQLIVNLCGALARPPLVATSLQLWRALW